MSSYKNLIKNSFAFGIGSFGSRIIAAILIPLYTHYLTPEEYGTVDIITVTAFLLLPIVSVEMYTATLRFTRDNKNQNEAVMTNALIVVLTGLIVVWGTYPIFYAFNVLEDGLLFLYLILTIQIFQRLFSYFTKAIGEVHTFAIDGILRTISLGTFNILFLIILGFGLNGYLSAMVLSYSLSVLFLFFKVGIYRFVNIKYIDKSLLKRMILFSVPVIPNTIMWWLINASSRYFILFFVGSAGNGLFAVANKIPTLCTMFNDIFTQAWQLSAFDEYESKENTQDFYSNVFNYFAVSMILLTSAVLIVFKPVMYYTVAEEYYNGWIVVPFLMLGVVFSSYSGFLGANYLAAKKTSGILKTSGIGGIISLLLNLILIPTLGIVGAGLSSMSSFLVIWLLRVYDTRKHVEILIDYKKLIYSFTIVAVQIAFLFLNLNLFVESGIMGAFFIVLIISNQEIVKIPLKHFLKRRQIN